MNKRQLLRIIEEAIHCIDWEIGSRLPEEWRPFERRLAQLKRLRYHIKHTPEKDIKIP